MHKMGDITSAIGASEKVSSVINWKNFVFYSVIIAVLATILLGGIVQSLQQHSMKPLLTAVVDKLLLVSNDLDKACLQIIENKGIYTQNAWFGKNIWDFISNTWLLFSSLIIIFFWVKLFSKIISMSPLSEQGRWFVNTSLGLLIFLILEMFGVLIYGAVNHEINTISDALRLLGVPFIVFGHLFKAIGYIIAPAASLAEKYYNNSVGNGSS